MGSGSLASIVTKIKEKIKRKKSTKHDNDQCTALLIFVAQAVVHGVMVIVVVVVVLLLLPLQMMMMMIIILNL